MKRTLALLLMMAALPAAAQAQRPVSGNGTPETIPLWTGASRIGNSSMTQNPDGSVTVNGGASVLGAPTTGVLGSTNSTVDFSSGVRGFNGGTSGRINGIVGDVNSPDGWGAVGINHATTGGTGVLGIANATTGFSLGVQGIATNNPDGIGVLGNGGNSGVMGFGSFNGVLGTTQITSGLGFGVQGIAELSVAVNPGDQGGIGVLGRGGWIAGLFQVTSLYNSNILVGSVQNGPCCDAPVTNVFRVDATGKGFFNGGTQVGGADFAESMPVSGDIKHYEPGDVLVIDAHSERRLAKSQEAYATNVAGVYSTKPGVLATPYSDGDPRLESEAPLAIVGIVPCKVTAANGAIRPGDLLVTSSVPGYAMKGTDRSKMLGAVVGKALEPLDSDTGVILVLITLQ